jgi:hypothetical protein
MRSLAEKERTQHTLPCNGQLLPLSACRQPWCFLLAGDYPYDRVSAENGSQAFTSEFRFGVGAASITGAAVPLSNETETLVFKFLGIQSVTSLKSCTWSMNSHWRSVVQE